MDNLFVPYQSGNDKRYLLVRDDSRFLDQKAYLENLWQIFSPFADSDFKSELSYQFHPRFWEMYLACALLQNGFELIPRHSPNSPDIHIRFQDRDVWIEATAPDAGIGADALAPIDNSVGFIKVPEEQIILRLTNSIQKKCQKYQEYVSLGLISSNDVYLLGINGFDIPFSLMDKGDIPFIAKSVFPFGDMVVTIDTGQDKVIDQGYKYRKHIQKKSSSFVPTTTFQDPSYSFLSGIIYSRAELWNLPRFFGDDFLYVQNPIADQKLETNWLGCGMAFWLEGRQLKAITINKGA